MPTPKPLTDDEVRGLRMPTYVALAETSLSGPGAERRARALLPRGTVVVWPGTTHSLPMQAARQLDAELVRFWAASE